jgi:uncharacterized caspase-like protein
MRLRLLRTALVLITLIFATQSAFAEKRVALVVGNDKYDTLPDLNNAQADARGMATKLKGLGFEVILRLNVTRRDMGRAIDVFQLKLSSADVGLVFYAGHGIQSDGRNYLVPSNAQIETKNDLRYEGIASNDFLVAMKNAGSQHH